jgi:uncharacterized membrane protein (DUF106 family)
VTLGSCEKARDDKNKALMKMEEEKEALMDMQKCLIYFDLFSIKVLILSKTILIFIPH